MRKSSTHWRCKSYLGEETTYYEARYHEITFCLLQVVQLFTKAAGHPCFCRWDHGRFVLHLMHAVVDSLTKSHAEKDMSCKDSAGKPQIPSIIAWWWQVTCFWGVKRAKRKEQTKSKMQVKILMSNMQIWGRIEIVRAQISWSWYPCIPLEIDQENVRAFLEGYCWGMQSASKNQRFNAT